jgi:hypothetical protein
MFCELPPSELPGPEVIALVVYRAATDTTEFALSRLDAGIDRPRFASGCGLAEVVGPLVWHRVENKVEELDARAAVLPEENQCHRFG